MTRLVSAAILFGLSIPRPAVADPLPAHAREVVAYTIVATLDAAAHTVTATERVTWRNPSAAPVGELWLHLYLNAFRNTHSTFMRESHGQLRDIEMPPNGWGWIDLTSLALSDGTDLLTRATFESPDDGNPDDRTVMRVMLPVPVPAGGEVAFEAAFTSRLPRVFARTGYAGDYHLVGQWFPKLGVYETAGMRGRTAPGWNCHQFHANSEFYADYGRFDVTITTPARFVVGATGRLTGTATHADGTVTRRYEQRDVHDFAWTADPAFIEVTSRFSATDEVSDDEYHRAAALEGRPVEEMRLGDVAIRLLVQPAHLRQAGRYLDAARAAIRQFGLWYGRYPYPTLTIVDPPYDGLGSGGMEYPTFITAGTSRLLNHWPFTGIRLADEVVVHELAHQFWYGLVGSNEFEEAWMDEGITSYSTSRLMDRRFGPRDSVATFLGLHVGETDLLRMWNGPSRVLDRIHQPAWTYRPGTYSFYTYDKPALALATLERILGEPTMARVMRTYAERWRFRHPASEDFYRTAEAVAGRDLSWFFGPVFEGNGVVEYDVDTFASNRETPPAGRLGKTRAVTPSDDPEPAAPYRSTVIVRRRGDVVLPQTIRLTFESGRVETAAWSGAERWHSITRSTPDRLVRVDVDPGQRNLLDVNWVNNTLRRAPDPAVSRTWTARCLFWLQELVMAAGL